MKTKAAKPAPKSSKYKYHILVAILVFTAIVYWPSLQNDFVSGDDYTLIVDNPDIQSFKNVPKFFTQPYHSMYCPVKMISHTVDYSFSGGQPAGYHFFSLLYHLINVALVFYLISLLLPNAWAAGMAALLFAIHPINVETVDWITGRGDILYGGFYFAGLIAYIFYLQKGYRTKYMLFTFLFFALSSLSKVSAFTFPLALLALDWYYHRKILSKRVILEKLPFLIGAVILGLSAISLRAAEHSVPVSEYLEHFSSIDNIVILIYPLTFYLAKFFIPYKLALPYPHPFASELPLSLDFYLYPLILVALAVLIWRVKTIRRPLTFALLFYLAALVSALRLSPMLGTIAADRYFYVSMVGVVFFIAWGFSYLSEHKNVNKRAYPLFVAAVVLFSGVMVALTHQRIKAFKNGITLFGDAHQKYPQHATPLYELTGAYMQAGDLPNILTTAGKITALLPHDEGALGFHTNVLLQAQQYDDALKTITRLVAIKPQNSGYLLNKAYLHRELNQPDSALAAIEKVIEQPEDSTFLAAAYDLKIDTYVAAQRYQEALGSLNELLEKQPHNTLLLMNRAICYFETGNRTAAINDMDSIVGLEPSNAIAFVTRGKMYSLTGEQEKACADWRIAAGYNNTEAIELVKNCP